MRKRIKKISCFWSVIIFVVFIAWSSVNITVISATTNTFLIKDDETGGDCYLIGEWDKLNKTCSLLTDINLPTAHNAVQIISDFVTFNGNGHIITGPGIWAGLSRGVYVSGRTGVTIKNLTTKNFWRGISLEYSNNNFVLNNIAENNGWGIYLIASSINKLIENSVISNWGVAGVGIQADSNHNSLTGNIISSNLYGIFARYADNNLLINNDIRNNVFGIGDLTDSDNNRIYNNNFINNQNQIMPQGFNTGNVFNLEKPTGGNYWSNFDEPNEGCSNVDNDDFCDNSHYFLAGADYLPWKKESGWRIVPAIIDVKPETLNKSSKSNRNAVTVYIEIPNYDVNEIDRTTIMLTTTQGSISAQSSLFEVGDYDNDSLPDLMVKIERQKVIEIVEIGSVKMIINGKIGNKIFEGSGEIKVIK